MTDDQIIEAAALWYARQDAEDMDWEQFGAWLEADVRHRQAFDEMAFLGAEVDARREAIADRLDAASSKPVPRRWWVAGGVAMAAALVGAIVLTHGSPPHPPASSEVAAGENARSVMVADARITLAPRSRLTVVDGDPQHLRLDGRGAFSIPHRATRSVRVDAGEYEVRDLGTRFEILAAPRSVQVTVAEGAVTLAGSGGEQTKVTAGRTATAVSGQAIVVSASRHGGEAQPLTEALIYENTPLMLVAADVSRASGVHVTVDPRIAARPFSGILAPGSGSAMANAIAALAGLHAGRDGETIYLRDRARP